MYTGLGRVAMTTNSCWPTFCRPWPRAPQPPAFHLPTSLAPYIWEKDGGCGEANTSPGSEATLQAPDCLQSTLDVAYPSHHPRYIKKPEQERRRCKTTRKEENSEKEKKRGGWWKGSNTNRVREKGNRLVFTSRNNHRPPPAPANW